MWEDIPALQFAIELGQAPTDSSAKVREKVAEFAGGGAPDSATVLKVQEATRALLDDLWRDGAAGFDLRWNGIIAFRPTRERASHRRLRVMVNSDAMSLPDRFTYRLIRLLEVHGDKLRECHAPKSGSNEPCGRLFLKVTRKEFCSEQCRARAHRRHERRGTLELAPRKERDGKATRKRRR
jgi:hypothetical protein